MSTGFDCRRRKSPLPVASALLLLALGAIAWPAAADWRQAFAKGVRARDMGQWREAASWMRTAIAEKPAETGEKVRVYGMKWERYLPHYGLGMALYQLGDCRAALAAFEQSGAAGAVGIVGRARMERRVEDCRSRLGLASGGQPSSSGTAGPPAGTRPSGGGVSPPRRQPPATPPRRPTPSQRPADSAPPPTAPQRTTAEARQEVLREKVAQAEGVLRKAGAAASAVDRHLERTRRAPFRGRPDLEKRYEAAYRRLNNARFVLSAGRRENDLQAVQRADAEARAALAEMELVGREINAPAAKGQ